MKIRYIVSLGGADPRQANEKSKNGNWVWYDVDDYEAVRLIDAEIAVSQTQADYKSAKDNYSKLESERKEAREISETIKNLDAMKKEVVSKKETYKALADDIKNLEARINKAESIQ